MVNNSTYLVHHGIKGQHWGKRNGPPYPLDAEDHSSSERREGVRGWTSKAKREERKRSNQNEPNEKKGLSEKQKKALKIAGATVGVAAVAALAYYGVKSGKVQNLASVGKSLLSKKTTKPGDLGIVVNPDHHNNNCKEVAEATIKRWLGVDTTAVAGPKSISGNLHDFIEKRGYNKAGVEWIRGETGSKWKIT